MSRGILAIVLCVVAGVVEAQQPELPPAPGKVVDIGGRRLHAICSGQGAPTVVLEAGASSFAIDWTLVQRQIDRTHRVCSYDRAGMGWSDPDAPDSSTQRDLHTLLKALGETPPYVMVGASRGGLMVRDYLIEYPDDVAGLVFVDPTTEDRLFTVLNGKERLIAELTPEQVRSRLPSQPVPVPRRKPQTGAPFDRLPADLYQVRVKLDERLIASAPATITPDAIGEIWERERAQLARLRATRTASPHPFGDRPTVVLTRGDEKNADREVAHAAVAQLSSRGRHLVIAGAGHEIHLFQPDAVISAILDVARQTRVSK
jgi:pimeloyl-ACP methyl ester carboxylesterase